MATNKYFNHFGYGREQDLVEDLIIEAIKVYGLDVRYIPRSVIAEDQLFGEDPASKFELAVPVEMYIVNVEGFSGEGDLLSRFGIQVRDQITFTVAKKRFEQIRQQKLLTEVGYNFVFEDGSTKTPSRQRLSQSTNYDNISLNSANNYVITSERPMEGDLIYFPLVDKTFEISFVEHEQIFYQTGRLQTYELRCELFEYSSEQFNTGQHQIDKIEDFSFDILDMQLLMENDDNIALESGRTLIQEFVIDSVDSQSDNQFFQTESREIVNFSESNPFGETIY